MSTILITGAGRGLGYELARQYAAEGWRVIGTVRDERAKLPGSVERQIADVTDRKQIAALGRALRGVPIDVLYCNAGISGKRGMALGSFDYESWKEVLRVNLLGAAAVTEALLPNVLAGERKVIAMMSSRLGSIAEASGMTLPYATSKAALNMLVKGLAATLARSAADRGGAEPRLGANRHGWGQRAARARDIGRGLAPGDRGTPGRR